jgi:hypothetical protein
VPIARALRRFLLGQRLRQRGVEESFVFSATGERPFDPPTIAERARVASLPSRDASAKSPRWGDAADIGHPYSGE